MIRLITAVLFAALVVASRGPVLAQSGYTPVRVFDSARGAFTDFETMVAEAGRADVVFVGETHNSEATHKLELALLEGLARRRGQIILSLEMFERDVQDPLAHFLMGHMDEADFIRDARAWPNYRVAYKPLVDLAIKNNWPVVAANVPRQLAAEVASSGMDVLKTKPESEKHLFARELRCPVNDAYFRRFRDLVGQHQTGATAGVAAAERYYQAQCLKDETMGESIAEAHSVGAMDGKRPLVVHINGAFHSEFRDGVVERTRRRLPEKRLMTMSVLPVADLDRLAPDAEARRRADYLVYTLTAPPGGVPSADSSSSAR